MRIFLMVLVSLTLCFSKSFEKELERLNDMQLNTMIASLKMGKDTKTDFILAAIAWRETGFGRIRANESDGKYGSYGAHQILLDTFMIRYKEIYDLLGKEVVKKLLMWSDEISAKLALVELSYWDKRHKGNMKKMLASYNAGNKGINSSKGLAYANDVLARAKAIEKYVTKNDLYY